MVSFFSLLLREVIWSGIFGLYIYGWTCDKDFFKCLCYIPICSISIARTILHFIKQLKNERIYCGLKSDLLLSLMNIPLVPLVIFIFIGDFILALRDSIPPVIVYAAKCYIFLVFEMYARFYVGSFNLELNFPLFQIAIEASVISNIWNLADKQVWVSALVALIYQILIYVLIMPKQKKEIVCLLDSPFPGEKPQTPAASAQGTPANNKKKSSKSTPTTNKKTD